MSKHSISLSSTDSATRPKRTTAAKEIRNYLLTEAIVACRKIADKAQNNPDWETAYCDGVFDGVEDCIDVLEGLKR